MVESWLERAARTRPHAPAVNDLTYAQLLDRARRLRLDAGPGDRVALALAPGADFAVALHGVWLRGATAVPHDLRLPAADRPAADVVLDHAEPSGPPLPPGSRHDLDAVALGLRTSGTTGPGKPVDLTFGNLLWSALGSAVLLGVDPADRWLCALPLSHVGGLSILARSAIYATAAAVLPGWDTERVAAELRAGRASLVSLVPTTLARLLDDAALDRAPALRWALLGGAPIPDVLLGRTPFPVAATYGLTEAASQVTTFGHPLFCTRVTLEADGEILVAGPTVAPASGPLLRTGDLGAFDAGGRLRIVGRKADTIVTGGENVAPTEVEAVLEAHPAVAEAGVHGREDPEWGEAVVAVVVLRDGMRATAQELRDHCAARLARFQVPKDVRFATVLPRTASGKLRRAGLKSCG
ncbi:MAG TPA: AMP-binding protein [Baekduia sp.]|nr:AMP-binding protein [Baekduia sp.]